MSRDSETIRLEVKPSGRRIARLLQALFVAPALAFVATNISVALLNAGYIPQTYLLLITVVESIAVMLSTAGLTVTVALVVVWKPRLSSIFRKADPADRLNYRVLFAGLTVLNALLSIIGQRQLQYVWVLLSLGFFYILFSIDEYVRDQTGSP
jgi:hypothetical protein